MGPWPFDRLMDALAPLCANHDVFVQTGTSDVFVDCEHERFIGYHECQQRMAHADVVVMHAGNSVRLAQRMGKTPIIVAREAARGEMRNDHQVPYAAREGELSRAITLTGDSDVLGKALVDAVESRAWNRAPGQLATASGDEVGELLSRLPEVRTASADNPFERHPTARFGWAFEQLRGRAGTHLDLGIGDAAFLRGLVEHSDLNVT